MANETRVHLMWLMAFAVLGCVLFLAGVVTWPTSRTALAVPTTQRATKEQKLASTGPFVAVVKRRGLVDCFPAGTMRAKRRGVPATCETSAVLFDGKHVLMASDKDIPGTGRSAVFQLDYDASKPFLLPQSSRRYRTHKAFLASRKYEDMTVAPNGRLFFATTGFDRVKANGKWDKYNRLLYWWKGQRKVHVLKASLRDPKTGRIPLRDRIGKLLRNAEFPNGMPYFKVEGLAALPGNKLLFGIREWGGHYKAFQYSIKLLAMSYHVDKRGIVRLRNDGQLVYDFSLRAIKTLDKRVALSSLEYDRFHKQLYLLTSYETTSTARGLGAYLWRLSLSDIKRNRPATLAKTPAGKPLHFAHKAEAITVIDKRTLLVVHDDDRVLGSLPVRDPTRDFVRKRHQAAYTFVQHGVIQ